MQPILATANKSPLTAITSIMHPNSTAAARQAGAGKSLQVQEIRLQIPYNFLRSPSGRSLGKFNHNKCPSSLVRQPVYTRPCVMIGHSCHLFATLLHVHITIRPYMVSRDQFIAPHCAFPWKFTGSVYVSSSTRLLRLSILTNQLVYLPNMTITTMHQHRPDMNELSPEDRAKMEKQQDTRRKV